MTVNVEYAGGELIVFGDEQGIAKFTPLHEANPQQKFPNNRRSFRGGYPPASMRISVGAQKTSVGKGLKSCAASQTMIAVEVETLLQTANVCSKTGMISSPVRKCEMDQKITLLLIYLFLTSTHQVVAQEASAGTQSDAATIPNVQPAQLLEKLVGKWEGTCRTWFEPGKLADESKVAGEFVVVLDGKFIRHTYLGSINGKSRQGEELIAFNGISKSFQVSWVDAFHMNYAIMFSQGKQRERGFAVTGEYDVGPNKPRWKWRTEYQFFGDDNLTITAYNIHPDGMESKAVETRYKRLN